MARLNAAATTVALCRPFAVALAAAMPLPGCSGDPPIDPMIEGLACAEIKHAWLREVGLSEENAHFRSCSLGYREGRIVAARITAATWSMPDRKGLECQEILGAVQKVVGTHEVRVHATVLDVYEDPHFYSTVTLVADGFAFAEP